MENFKIYRVITLIFILISTNISAYDLDCAYKNKGRLCNYRGYPGGKCSSTSKSEITNYCGDTGENCFCSKPDYVIE